MLQLIMFDRSQMKIVLRLSFQWCQWSLLLLAYLELLLHARFYLGIIAWMQVFAKQCRTRMHNVISTGVSYVHQCEGSIFLGEIHFHGHVSCRSRIQGRRTRRFLISQVRRPSLALIDPPQSFRSFIPRRKVGCQVTPQFLKIRQSYVSFFDFFFHVKPHIEQPRHPDCQNQTNGYSQTKTSHQLLCKIITYPVHWRWRRWRKALSKRCRLFGTRGGSSSSSWGSSCHWFSVGYYPSVCSW